MNSEEMTKHSVIIIPPLKTNESILKFATRNWEKKYGISVTVLNVWDTEEDFHSMLVEVVDKIDELSKRGHFVSLIGASGGGNMALNAFIMRRKKVKKAINVCGRIRVGNHHDLDPETSDKQLKAYIDSINFLESSMGSISVKERKKIMTISPRFGQEFVPDDTVDIDGCNNIKIPTFEHILSILAALTIFRGRLIEFIQA